MTIEEKAFEKTKWVFERLESYGFQKNTESREVQYVYHTDLLEGAFEVEILVTEDGKVKGTVLDSMTEEEYFQIRVESGMGAYVHTVRHAYEELLADIAEKCTEPLPFVSDQANRLTAAIFRKYGEKPDFPWTGENESAGVFRNPENQKWYGLIMRVEENRLTKQKEDQEKLDILNLKIREEEGETLRAEKGIYPAWHMNHRTWISVRLDDTLTDERILELIEVSRSFTQNQRAKKKASGNTDNEKTEK